MKLNLKSKRGITLIALMVTIIVLLILAGISIAMISGDNSLIQKTNEAKEMEKAGEKREELESAVLASYKKNGVLDITTLLEKLNGINGITVTPTNTFPVKVKVNDTTYKITSDGKVEQKRHH